MPDYKVKPRGVHVDPDYILDGRMYTFAGALTHLWTERQLGPVSGPEYLRQLPEFDSVQIEPSNDQLGIPAEMTDFAAALDAFDRPSYVEGASYLFFIDNDPRFVVDEEQV